LTFRPRFSSPRIRKDSSSRKNISEHSDQFQEFNSEAVLAVIAILAGDTIFAKKSPGVQTHSKTHASEIEGRDSRLYFLMTKDAEIIPGNILYWS